MCFYGAIADSQEWAGLLLGLDQVNMDTSRRRLMPHVGTSDHHLRGNIKKVIVIMVPATGHLPSCSWGPHTGAY